MSGLIEFIFFTIFDLNIFNECEKGSFLLKKYFFCLTKICFISFTMISSDLFGPITSGSFVIF